MTNQRADFWSGLMALGTLGLCTIPNTPFIHIPLVIFTTVSLIMLIRVVNQVEKQKNEQDAGQEHQC